MPNLVRMAQHVPHRFCFCCTALLLCCILWGKWRRTLMQSHLMMNSTAVKSLRLFEQSFQSCTDIISRLQDMPYTALPPMHALLV